MLLFPPKSKRIPGLKYSLCLFTMGLGRSVFSFSRYKFNTLALLAWWDNEEALDQFLVTQKYTKNSSTWYIRMRPYRRWGSLKGLDSAHLFKELKNPIGTVVGLTVASLKLSQVRRFTKWGKPVESQVARQKGKKLAVVSMRPLQKFSTFSIWESEKDMLNMVRGRNASHTEPNEKDMNHQKAMQARSEEPFHDEFTTMRFVAFGEEGVFEERTAFL